MSLLFHADHIPPNKAHQLCVFCHRYSINTVRENEGMGQQNNAKDTRHKEKMEGWTKYQVSVEASKKRNKDPPPKPDDPHSTSDLPKKLTQNPQKPGRNDIETPMVQCMCLTAYCLQIGTYVGSLCFAKCRLRTEGSAHHPSVVDENAARHPCSGASWQRCTCPICRCQCNKRYRIADIQQIAERQLVRSRLQLISKGEGTGERNTMSYLNRNGGIRFWAGNK